MQKIIKFSFAILFSFFFLSCSFDSFTISREEIRLQVKLTTEKSNNVSVVSFFLKNYADRVQILEMTSSGKYKLRGYPSPIHFLLNKCKEISYSCIMKNSLKEINMISLYPKESQTLFLYVLHDHLKGLDSKKVSETYLFSTDNELQVLYLEVIFE